MILRLSTLAVLAALALTLGLASPAAGSVEVTSGPAYDRDPSQVTLAGSPATTWLFFARTESPCNRLLGCGSSTASYDLMVTTRSGSAVWTAPTLVAANPAPGGSFYGRTVSAVKTSDGAIWVFWSSGGSAESALAFRRAPDAATFTPLTGPGGQFFNVAAVANGLRVLVYTESATGTIAARTVRFSAGEAVYGSVVHVASGFAVPRAMRDRSGTYRLVMSDRVTGAVDLASSTDGRHFGAPAQVVAPSAGVFNWDPVMAETVDGVYHLVYAPDLGNGRQRIETRTSSDLSNWSAATALTQPGGNGGYDDFWPTLSVSRATLRVYFASESATGGGAEGVAHIRRLRVR